MLVLNIVIEFPLSVHCVPTRNIFMNSENVMDVFILSCVTTYFHLSIKYKNLWFELHQFYS